MERPLIRWAGSKRLQLPTIRSYWPKNFERYVEPFCGSCAALNLIGSKPALMNDINTELINFWRVLKEQPVLLHECLASKPCSSDRYYEMRAEAPHSLPPFDRAVRFAYLNRYSFNGLYRTNRKGQYNVPFGGRRVGAFPSRERFEAAATQISAVQFECGDFERLLEDDCRSGDFIYLDPPYVMKGSRVSGGYDGKSFSQADIERLLACLERLHHRNIKFLLSYAPDEDMRDSLGAFFKGSYEVTRRISGFRKGRLLTSEFVFANY